MCAAMTPPTVREALKCLVNSAGGALSAFEPELREAMGNTNYEVIKQNVVLADAALAGEPVVSEQSLMETLQYIWRNTNDKETAKIAETAIRKAQASQPRVL